MIRKTLWIALPLAALAGCNSDSNNNTPEAGSFTANILHINDHHSHLEEGSQSLMIAGQST